jgi:hypothetical protein
MSQTCNNAMPTFQLQFDYEDFMTTEVRPSQDEKRAYFELQKYQIERNSIRSVDTVIAQDYKN